MSWIRQRRARLITLPLLVVMSSAYQGTGGALSVEDYIRNNALAIVVLVFHLGVSWREFLDHRRRLQKLEDYNEDQLPVKLKEVEEAAEARVKEMARADILTVQLAVINRRLDSIDVNIEALRSE